MDAIKKAERAVLRAAVGAITKEGWAFREQGDGNCPVVCLPDAMRRLENAVAKLRAARKVKQAFRCKKPNCWRWTDHDSGYCFQHRAKA